MNKKLPLILLFFWPIQMLLCQDYCNCLSISNFEVMLQGNGSFATVNYSILDTCTPCGTNWAGDTCDLNIYNPPGFTVNNISEIYLDPFSFNTQVTEPGLYTFCFEHCAGSDCETTFISFPNCDANAEFEMVEDSLTGMHHLFSSNLDVYQGLNMDYSYIIKVGVPGCTDVIFLTDSDTLAYKFYEDFFNYEIVFKEIFEDFNCSTDTNIYLNNASNLFTADFSYQNDSLSNVFYFEPNFLVNDSNYTVNYFWTLGYSDSSYLAEPVHVFPQVGNFYVCLDVEFEDFCAERVCKWVNVPIGACHSEFSVAIAPLDIEFWPNLYGSAYTYLWDFGNGTTSTEITPLLYLTNPDTLYTCVTIEHEDYCITNYCDTIEFYPCSSYFQFEVNDNELTLFPVIESEHYIYNWDFGDGNSSSEISPTHFYSETGSYVISFTISNPWGCESFRDINWTISTVPEYTFNENSSIEIEVFQKINKDQIVISASNLNLSEKVVYMLYDSNGRMIYSADIAAQETLIPNTFSSGMYIGQMVKEDVELWSHKFIIP